MYWFIITIKYILWEKETINNNLFYYYYIHIFLILIVIVNK